MGYKHHQTSSNIFAIQHSGWGDVLGSGAMVKYLPEDPWGSRAACGPLSKELDVIDPVREHRVVAEEMSPIFRFFPFRSCVDVCMHMLRSAFLLLLLYIYIYVHIYIYIYTFANMYKWINMYIYIYDTCMCILCANTHIVTALILVMLIAWYFS